MSFNGSGTYSLPTNSFAQAVTGTTISSTGWNATGADLATALTLAVCKDGQSTATARIPFAQGISVTTDITTPSTTFAIANTTATTVNLAGAATTLNIGNAGGTTTLRGSTIALGAATGTTTVAGSMMPQNSQSAAYTTVAADANKMLLHPTADDNARTFTIDSNDNVPYPVGTCITFVNQQNTLTIAITDDTLVLVGPGSTGSRTLAENGMATALKVASTTWWIAGIGLS